jgi:hypothetical protein
MANEGLHMIGQGRQAWRKIAGLGKEGLLPRFTAVNTLPDHLWPPIDGTLPSALPTSNSIDTSCHALTDATVSDQWDGRWRAVQSSGRTAAATRAQGKTGQLPRLPDRAHDRANQSMPAL